MTKDEKREYDKKYYAANKNKMLAQNKTYREDNKEEISIQRKTYRETHDDETKERRKKWYNDHKDEAKNASKEWYETNKYQARTTRETWRKSNKPRMNQYNKSYNHKNRANTHRIRAKRYYGITSDQYDVLVKEAGQNCPICGTAFDWINRHKANRPCIDHCHKTGVVRGIICGKCNAAVGQLNDDISLLEKAIQWLKKTSQTDGADELPPCI